MFADEFLPVYDVSDEVATVVAAEPEAVWEALLGCRPDRGRQAQPRLPGCSGPCGCSPSWSSHLLHGERPPHGPAGHRCGCAS